MSVSNSSGTSDKDGLLATDKERDAEASDSESSARGVDTDRTAKATGYPSSPYAYLSAPGNQSLRPASPSTLSILSHEELEELNPERPYNSYADGAGQKVLSGTTPHGRFQQFWFKHKGVIWALLAQAFGAMMNMATQTLEREGNKGKGLDAFEILFVRMGITVFFSVLYMWHQSTPHFPFGAKEIRLLLVGRAIGGFMGVYGMYYSLRYLPVQLAVVITFLSPFLTNFVCSKIYGEPFTRVDKITSLVSLVGVILLAHPETLIDMLIGHGNGVAGAHDNVPPASGSGDMMPGNGTAIAHRPSTPAEQASAVGVALIGVLGSALAYTTIRVIGKRAHPLISVNYFACSCFIISAIVLAIKRHVTLPSDARDWGLLIFLGTCGFTMQFLLAKGLSHEKSAKATNMQFSQMFFAMLGDKLLFGYTPDLKALLGSALIVGGVIVMLVQKTPAKTQHPETSGVAADEESRTGLLAESRDLETGEDHDRLRAQGVQMRDLR